ncbi:hypothetical protein XA68_16755 [Ophiocordyceps unilateralis]|uniref:Uncharacterized protein n=1 Tax=Ophiocordyceps unilateralis TaxID=268505 RepID=A0A2A9P4P2_OPHUN|nr:hypothetical protein XA68_16755 [Ophiocordyceps unilateralis]
MNDVTGPAPAPVSVLTPLMYGSVSPRPLRVDLEADPATIVPTGEAGTATEACRVQRIAVSVFAALHIARGLLCLAYPATSSGRLSGLVVGEGERSGATYLLSALLGVRDALLGGLLATADRRCGHELRRALAVNLLSDAADTFLLIFAAACAWQRGRTPAAEIAVVATMAILEHLTLWSMAAPYDGANRSGAAAYEARLQAHEDKQLRLDMWLADMRRGGDEVADARPSRE